ncbi:MAG: hypothetical protein FWG38_11420, partial [Defluviitaleaceae bacterium]|nr:hypothetical protein [Defluviitaleaceae bacterium]
VPFHIEDRTQSWTAVELAGGENPTRTNAESFAMAAGLGRPDYVLTGGAIALARVLPMLPLAVLAAYTLALVIGFVKKHCCPAAAPLFFAGLILFAVLLPLLLGTLPAWVIPTHWSDFAFWSQLLIQAGNSLREFLSAPPALRDVELKMYLLKQAGVAVLSLCVSIVVCATWHRRPQVIQ